MVRRGTQSHQHLPRPIRVQKANQRRNVKLPIQDELVLSGQTTRFLYLDPSAICQQVSSLGIAPFIGCQPRPRSEASPPTAHLGLERATIVRSAHRMWLGFVVGGLLSHAVIHYVQHTVGSRVESVEE